MMTATPISGDFSSVSPVVTAASSAPTAAATGGAKTMTTTTTGFSRRKLGNNELFCNLCHAHQNLNVMCGLTLLTRHAVDEGLMKCALQEFQHTYPQLTSRIRRDPSDSQLYFQPMECPTLPLDTDFQCKDMLHQRFDTENGPLWRVQLITEATMDRAALGFGPELAAIVGDGDSSAEVRWRYFLRYFQGNVNGREVDQFDEEEEGHRCFVLVTFHPSITDTVGSFHLMRQLMYMLDAILEAGEEDSDSRRQQYSPAADPELLHSSVECLLPPGESSLKLADLVPAFKLVGSFVMPRKSPFENLSELQLQHPAGSGPRTEVLRGRLDEEQTAELLAMMEEDDATLHGVILAAGLVAVSRILQSGQTLEYPPPQTLHLRATNEVNLRQYCASQPQQGCHTTYYEADYTVPPVTDRAEFWRFAHEVSVKHNTVKGSKEPLKLLRVYNKMFSVGGEPSNMFKVAKIQNELGAAAYGDLGGLFRRESGLTSTFAATAGPESWNKVSRNIRLEDVFHMVAAQNMGSPMTHTGHLLHGRLNYILLFHTTYVGQGVALKVRDEVVAVLRMAAEKL